MKWSEAYEHSGWTIVVPVKLIHAIGAKGAILVSQLFYWKGKEQSENGWIYKTKAELEAETGLSRYEQDTCTEDLKQKKILVTHYDRLDHRLYYRICTEALDAIMEADLPSESGKSTFGKSPSEGGKSPSESGKPAFAKGPKQLSPQRKRRVGQSAKPTFVINAQENTPENTTTTRPEASQAKARIGVTTPPSSSFFSVTGVEEEPPGILSAQDRFELDAIALEFDSDGRQKAKAVACAKRRGMAFVQEQAAIVRLQKTRLRNLAGAFEKACDSPEGWKRPKSTAKKPARKVEPSPKPEQSGALAPEPITPEQQQTMDAARRALLESLRNPSESPEAQAKTSAAEARYKRMQRRWDEASTEERNRWIAQGDPIIRKYFRADGPLPMRSLWSAIIPDADKEAEQPSQEAAA